MKIKNIYFERLQSSQIESILNKDLPIKLAYWIGRAFDKLNSESRTYFKMKQKLIEKWAEKDKNGKIKTEKDNQTIIWKDYNKFIKELRELQDTEVEINIKPIEIDLDELEKKGITFKPGEIMLMPFLKIKT